MSVKSMNIGDNTENVMKRVSWGEQQKMLS